MDIEFHYWMTGLIALRAGFNDAEAQTIAYASEFVDENDVCLRIQDRSGKHKDYRNFISQTMNITKPKNTLLRIYPMFHFIPGEPDAITARRRDGCMHLLNTTPNSENANRILDAAFTAHEDTRLYRIGIASHAYVDTWAHQNFVGWDDHFNNIGHDPKPNIGHADGEHHPDWVSHIWIDERLVESDVSNKNRFLSAAEALYLRYCQWLATQGREDRSQQWAALEDELNLVMGATYTGNRIRYEDVRLEGYRRRLKWDDFDERKWFDEAIDSKIHGLRDSHDGIKAIFTHFQDEYFWHDIDTYQSSDWYRFQQAVKEHERYAIEVLTPTFHQMGVDLRVV
jgi:hypothetical protein